VLVLLVCIRKIVLNFNKDGVFIKFAFVSILFLQTVMGFFTLPSMLIKFVHK
jgi:hypothetical protein